MIRPAATSLLGMRAAVVKKKFLRVGSETFLAQTVMAVLPSHRFLTVSSQKDWHPMYFTVPFLRPYLNDNSETNSSVNTLLSCASSARFIVTSRHFFFVRTTNHHAFFLCFGTKSSFVIRNNRRNQSLPYVQQQPTESCWLLWLGPSGRQTKVLPLFEKRNSPLDVTRRLLIYIPPRPRG